MQNLPASGYSIDRRVSALLQFCESAGYDQLLQLLKTGFGALAPETRQSMQQYFARFPFWGSLDAEAEDFGVLESRAKALSEHSGDFRWLYESLGDYRSRYTLFAFLNNWFAYDFYSLQQVKEHIYPDYFDLDLMPCTDEEVFVDLGAFTGDTVLSYVNTYGLRYQRIYCYEITPSTMETLRSNLQHLPRIELRQKGASDGPGTLFITEHDHSSANVLSQQGEIAVETVAIDQDIDEPITFLKMDIEGAEQAALRGCADHIRQNHPKLAISVYHNNEDIWKIARMIDEICPGYRFYLRHHGGGLIATELSLLAVYRGLPA